MHQSILVFALYQKSHQIGLHTKDIIHEIIKKISAIKKFSPILKRFQT
jgi:hypothetical protein